MNVKLLGHTHLSEEFIEELYNLGELGDYTDGQAIALSAIRTCYSHLKPSEILKTEGRKYFNTQASDGLGGTEADRLTRHIVNSGHTSTLEHINFTFAVEGVSRSLLAQLTRHRFFSYSVQSQRYCKFGSTDKSGGMNYVIPPSVLDASKTVECYESFTKWHGLKQNVTAKEIYEDAMVVLQQVYDSLREAGVPAEDARYVLPNAATTNITLTGNLRAILDFYSKRNPSTHAQHEISQLAEALKTAVIAVEPWTQTFFK